MPPPSEEGAPFRISPDLKEFLESGLATAVATADRTRRPHHMLAWAPMVLADGRNLAVYIENPRAGQVLADVAANGQMAILVADPVSYRSLQFKGHVVDTRPATADETAAVERHLEAFVSATSLVGDPPATIFALHMAGPLRRFEMAIDSAFDQTPGPEAGRPL